MIKFLNLNKQDKNIQRNIFKDFNEEFVRGYNS